MRHRASSCLPVLVVVLSGFLLGCVRADEQVRIEIDGNHSLEEKMRIGEQLNSEERLARVRAAVKKRFPELTDDDLLLLYIGYESGLASDPPSKRKVEFIIGMRYREDLNRRRIVKYIRDMLRPEVEAAMAAGSAR